MQETFSKEEQVLAWQSGDSGLLSVQETKFIKLTNGIYRNKNPSEKTRFMNLTGILKYKR